MKTKNKKTKDYSLFIGVVSFFMVLCLWIINLSYGLSLAPDSENTRGIFGDMFGAVNALFSGLAFAGIILTLYMQRKELELTRKDVKKTNKEFKIQNVTLEVQKFENQYYKMIDLHRANITDIEIPFFDVLKGSSLSHDLKTDISTSNTILRELRGKKVFVDMVKELEVCLADSLDILKSIEPKYKKSEIFEFAYKIFFWGVNSSFAISERILDEHQVKVKDLIRLKQKQYKEFYDISKNDLKIRYMPFQGHESRLAHYYRHLFQTVKYVVQQETNKLIKYEETRQYLRILRAQLSNAEQLMLYYNYICGFGPEWDKSGTRGNQYFTRYRMIHNMPVNRVKYVDSPREHFSDYIIDFCTKEDPLFEWGDYYE
tara:strand:+ start:788 stop:1903 length:1116 start_codon:yes stop_codon:yes gene_type:complete